jgi:hypothetical protein
MAERQRHTEVAKGVAETAAVVVVAALVAFAIIASVVTRR